MGKSKSQKKAEKEAKKYYSSKEDQQKETAATTTQRLQDDLNNIFKYAGISQDRAIQDYTTNIGNIEANKALDIASLNDYVATNTQRTGEDLSTSLAKEARRYSLQQDVTNQNLANAGMTFSERTQSKIDAGSNAQNTADINTVASRSFQDINRYEVAQNASIANTYGQQTAAAETSKTRTLQDIANSEADAIKANSNSVADVATKLKNNLSDLSYQKSDSLSDIGNAFTTQQNLLSNTAALNKITG